MWLGGWSQRGLAEEAVVSAKTLYNWREGRHWPSMRVFLDVARALDVDPNWLLSLAPDPATEWPATEAARPPAQTVDRPLRPW
jgi:transcriptional regulator with XRE-family HTH domain